MLVQLRIIQGFALGGESTGAQLMELEHDLLGDRVDCVIRGGALNDLSLIARRLGSLTFVTCATPEYLAVAGGLVAGAEPDLYRLFAQSAPQCTCKGLRGVACGVV